MRPFQGKHPITWCACDDEMILVDAGDVPPLSGRELDVYGIPGVTRAEVFGRIEGNVGWTEKDPEEAYFDAKRLGIDIDYILLVGDWNLSQSFYQDAEKNGFLNLDQMADAEPDKVLSCFVGNAARLNVIENESFASFILEMDEMVKSAAWALNMKSCCSRTPHYIDAVTYHNAVGDDLQSYLGLIDDDMQLWMAHRTLSSFPESELEKRPEYAEYLPAMKMSQDCVRLWRPVLHEFNRLPFDQREDAYIQALKRCSERNDDEGLDALLNVVMEIGRSYGLDSAVAALVSGVPVEDVLAA